MQSNYGILDFRAACDDVAEQQRLSLRSIIQLNGATSHPRKNGVAPANEEANVDALLQSLPITTYADYQPTVEAAIKAAERGDDEGYSAAAAELVGMRPDMFCCTTGTTGVSKLIPMHAARMAAAHKVFGFVNGMTATAFPECSTGKELQLGWRAPVRVLANGVWVGAISACGVNKYIAQYDKGDPVVRAVFSKLSSPVPVWKASNPHTAYYLHWLFALSRRDTITSISDGFASGVLAAANVLVEYQDALLADLMEGTAGAACDPARTERPLLAPGEEVARELGGLLQPNSELADELKEVFASGRAGLLERLFPRLQCIKCICTGSMAKFVPLLRQLVPTLPLLSGCYGATEGTFGVAAELVEFAELAASRNLRLNGSAGSGAELQHRTGSRDSSKQEEAAAEDVTSSSDGWEVPESPPSVLSGLDAREGEGELSFREFSREAPDQASYILRPDANCYLEFLPLEQGGDASPGTQEPLRMHELQVGQRYELLVTNDQGMWRYRMGDRLQCVGYWRTSPKVVVEGRTSQELNIASEKTPEPLLLELVHSVAARLLPEGVLGLKGWAARECIHESGSGAGHYIFYFELSGSGISNNDGANGRSGSASSSAAGGLAISLDDLRACAAALDGALSAPNSIYKSYRACGRLGPVELRIVAPGSFAVLRELALSMGAHPGQYKPPAVLTQTAQIELLDGRVLESVPAPPQYE